MKVPIQVLPASGVVIADSDPLSTSMSDGPSKPITGSLKVTVTVAVSQAVSAVSDRTIVAVGARVSTV